MATIDDIINKTTDAPLRILQLTASALGVFSPPNTEQEARQDIMRFLPKASEKQIAVAIKLLDTQPSRETELIAENASLKNQNDQLMNKLDYIKTNSRSQLEALRKVWEETNAFFGPGLNGQK